MNDTTPKPAPETMGLLKELEALRPFAHHKRTLDREGFQCYGDCRGCKLENLIAAARRAEKEPEAAPADSGLASMVMYPCGCIASPGSPSYCPEHGKREDISANLGLEGDQEDEITRLKRRHKEELAGVREELLNVIRSAEEWIESEYDGTNYSWCAWCGQDAHHKGTHKPECERERALATTETDLLAARDARIAGEVWLQGRIQCLKECQCRECLAMLPLALAELERLSKGVPPDAEKEAGK
jgi:hypothetical protein